MEGRVRVLKEFRRPIDPAWAEAISTFQKALNEPPRLRAVSVTESPELPASEVEKSDLHLRLVGRLEVMEGTG